MNCGEVRYELSAYLDHELPEVDRRAVEAHVVDCPGCRQRLTELERIVAGMGDLPVRELTPGFLAEVRRRLNAGVEPVAAWGWWVQTAAGAVAVLLVAGLAVWMLQEPPRVPERKSLAWKYSPPSDEKVMIVAADRGLVENEMSPPGAPRPTEKKAIDPTSVADGTTAKPFALAPAAPVVAKTKEQKDERLGWDAKLPGRQPAMPTADGMTMVDKRGVKEMPKVREERLAAERIVVEDANAVKVQTGAALIAASLQGRATPVRALPDGGFSFGVELPTANVPAFKARLTWQQTAEKGDAYAAAGEAGMQRMTTRSGTAGGGSGGPAKAMTGAPGAVANAVEARPTRAPGAATGTLRADVAKDEGATNAALLKVAEPVKEADDAVTVLEIQVKAPAP